MIKRNPRHIKRNTCDVKLIQLNSDTARALKKRLWIQAGGKCPILKKHVKVRDVVLDHKHKLKTQECGPHGRGLVRGAILDQINGFEGMVYKKYKRQGLHDVMPLPDLLESLAAYLRNPPCPQIYIYPSEKPKAPTFGKREYNLICKYHKIKYPKRKVPEFPKSGIKLRGKGKNRKKVYRAKLSNKWQLLIDMANDMQKGK